MSLPKHWLPTTIADVATAIFDGPFGSALKTSDYTDQGVRVARLENIGRLKFKKELKSFISETKANSLRRHFLSAGDILFSSFVDQDTRVCQLPNELDGQIINKADCFCIRTDPTICDPRFLTYRLAAPSSYHAFSDTVRGITRPRIGLRHLAALEIGLPPLAEQRRIVAKLDALLARVERAREELDKAHGLVPESARTRTLISRLSSAILAKAFRGELVPQEPNDAPASVLLDRIRARQASGPKPKGGRRSTIDHSDS